MYNTREEIAFVDATEYKMIFRTIWEPKKRIFVKILKDFSVYFVMLVFFLRLVIPTEFIRLRQHR